MYDDYVRVLDQGEVDLLGGFLDLVVGGDGGPVIRHGGGGDKDVAALFHRLEAGLVHVFGADHVDAIDPVGGVQGHQGIDCGGLGAPRATLVDLKIF